MPGVVADTHALIWFVLSSPRLSPNALARMRQAVAEGAVVYLATVSLVELLYLIEKGRLPAVVGQRVRDHLEKPGSGLVLVPLDSRVVDAMPGVPRDQVPDMPDRIIAATALSLGLPLVTRDAAIKAAGLETVW